ncbi:unnamed protein product [Schistosoma rodhaini]|uniref:Uncharacterized protein n=1 Tax=Schistosoma rodhaini TaxID=6188 RepID=A0AA85FV08_9TREM|nr:unnamed protein product [Schistosoma rodhaini]
MRRHNLEMFRISETHWTQAEQKKLASVDVLLYSGHEEENAPHTQGVAQMLSKEVHKAFAGWESYESRIISASFGTKEGITRSVIQCYAPTNDRNDDDKDQIYEVLQSTVEKCSEKELTILMEDLDAKVGIDNTEGVAQMLSKEIHKAFTGWESHESRIISAFFRTVLWNQTM